MRHPSVLPAAGFSILIALSVFLSACQHRVSAPLSPHPGAAQTAPQTATATLSGDSAHPGQTQGWVRTELYFGMGPADHPEQGIGETEWRDFLDREVTPRFLSGLSVEEVYGQWLSKGKTEPSRLRSKVLIILYPGTEENKAKIDEIRAAWKQKTGHQSVLRVTQPADVSF